MPIQISRGEALIQQAIKNGTATVDAAAEVGPYTSLTIGADGLGLISYQDITNGDLKVAHCASAFCTSYFRRR